MFPGSALEQRSRLSSCCRGHRSQARRRTGPSELWSHGSMSVRFVSSSKTTRVPVKGWEFSASCTRWGCCPDLRVIKQSYKSVSLTSFPFSPTGSLEGRAKSVGRSMGWRTEICGALPAGGRRPAKGSSTRDCNYAEDLGVGEDNSRTRLLQLHRTTSHFPSSGVLLGGFCWFFGVLFFFSKRALYFKVKHF